MKTPLLALLILVGCNTYDHSPAIPKTALNPLERTVWPQSQDLSQHFSLIKLTCGIALNDASTENAIESFEDFLQRPGIIDVSEVDMLNDQAQAITFENTNNSFKIKAVSRVVRDEVKDMVPSHNDPEILEENVLKNVPYITLEMTTSRGSSHVDMYPSFAGGTLEQSRVIDVNGVQLSSVTVKCNLESTPK